MFKRLFYILIIILFLFIFVFLFFKNINSQKNNFKNEISNKENNINVKQEKKNNTRSENTFFYQKAVEENNIELCKKIDISRSKELCFREIALKKNDLTICNLINDNEIKNKCKDDISSILAMKQKDYDFCSKKTSFSQKSACIKTMFNDIDDIKECETIKEDNLKNICYDNYYYLNALKNNDSDICKQIVDVYNRSNCLSKLLNISLYSDDDHDGLDFFAEIVCKTDYNNKDTDYDGFLDGYEVANGYNPKGEGILEVGNNLDCETIENEDLKNFCLSINGDNYVTLKQCLNSDYEDLKEYCREKWKENIKQFNLFLNNYDKRTRSGTGITHPQ